MNGMSTLIHDFDCLLNRSVKCPKIKRVHEVNKYVQHLYNV